MCSKLVGVVGVDAVIDDLENLLISDDFGLSYAFLINLEGRAVIHPHLRPSADVSAVIAGLCGTHVDCILLQTPTAAWNGRYHSLHDTSISSLSLFSLSL